MAGVFFSLSPSLSLSLSLSLSFQHCPTQRQANDELNVNVVKTLELTYNLFSVSPTNICIAGPVRSAYKEPEYDFKSHLHGVAMVCVNDYKAIDVEMTWVFQDQLL